MTTSKHHRRIRRRAESRLFEAIEAADAGHLRLAEDLLDRAAIPRRARRAVLGDERAAIRRQAATPRDHDVDDRSADPPTAELAV